VHEGEVVDLTLDKFLDNDNGVDQAIKITITIKIK